MLNLSFEIDYRYSSNWLIDGAKSVLSFV